jgi:hypothetical protein
MLQTTRGGFMVTRRTGYRLSAGKEEPALVAAEEFLVVRRGID